MGASILVAPRDGHDSGPEHVGSLTLDEELIDRAGFCSGEKAPVASVTSGARLGTNQLAGAGGGSGGHEWTGGRG
jgi:aspartate 1-decarboxylase